MHRFRWINVLLAAIAVVGVVLVSTASAERYDAVRESIGKGELLEAGSELEEILRSDFIDAAGFYYHSKIEQKGELALEFLQKSLDLCDDECGPIPAELADAYYALGRYQDVASLYKEYKKKTDRRPENFKFFWFAGMSFIELGDYKSAEKAFKEIEKGFDRVYLSGWGTLGKGSVEAERGEVSDARSVLKPLVSSGGEISALAIYNRAYIAARSGDKDDALFGYDILDQRFGRFLGTSELTGSIRSQTSGQQGGADDRFADTIYTIETGILVDKSEADKLVGKLRAAKWSAHLEDRVCDDSKCWVIRVGVFRSEHSARETKAKLESLFPGSYQVVIR
jgi:tetratricopeptide (TPR) repeat protein